MATTSSDPDLTVVGVVDAVTGRLREQILRGELGGGESVTEARVSSTFRVARPSAKAAIEQLVAAGLLARTAHRSARVVTIDTETARDVYRTRGRLESAALRELAERRAVPVEAMIANQELLEMPPGPDLATVEPDLRFHAALIDALGSARTSRMYRSVLDEVRLCMAQVQGRRLLDTRDIASQHEEILDAVGRGAADRAAFLLLQHLQSAEMRLIDAIEADL